MFSGKVGRYVRIYLDTADKKEIVELMQWGCFAGITTNPVILSNSKLTQDVAVKTLADAFTGDFFVQAAGNEAAEMIANAAYLSEKLGKRVIVKIPSTGDGLKAIKELSNRGIWTAATALFTPEQALLAAEAGADIVIPFYHRIAEGGDDPVRVIELIRHVGRSNGKPKVVVASIKSIDEINSILPLDVFGITVPPSLAREMIKSPQTDIVLERFNKAAKFSEE